MSTDFTFNQLRGRKNIVRDKLASLGDEGYLDDTEQTGTGPRRKLSAMPIRARVVKGNGALTPGRRVKYTSGLFGTEVEAAGAEQAHGIVDPELSGATATDDTFLIFIEGPMDVVSAGAISANAKVEGGSSGRVVTIAAGVAEGRMIEAASGADETKRAYMLFPQN